jgi:hypothetical protein
MMKLDTPVGDPIKLVLTTPANVVDHVHVVLLSGCKDSQESADVSATSEFGLPKHAGPAGAGGACTNAMLMTVHDDKPDDTWLSTLVTMRHWLHKNGYPQVPKLSCANAAFDWRAPFSLLHPHCRANPKKAGRTRALLIGINYTNSDSPLDGAWNDVDKAKKFAVASGYKEDVSSMRVLRDNGSDVSPTKVNIKKALKWLVNGASKGDSLFLHFSGHGVSLKDKDAFSDEADGKGKYFPFTTFRRLIAHTRLKLSFLSYQGVPEKGTADAGRITEHVGIASFSAGYFKQGGPNGIALTASAAELEFAATGAAQVGIYPGQGASAKRPPKPKPNKTKALGYLD